MVLLVGSMLHLGDQRAARDDSDLQMILALDSAFNVRDFGGVPTRSGGIVRPGALWRADSLHRLRAADVERIERLGLRTIVDLRSPGEIAATASVVGALRDTVVHELPVYTDVRALHLPTPIGGDAAQVDAMVHLYGRLLALGGPAMAEAVNVLGAEGALPGLLQCAAGKDRTGIVAAFVLSLLGVADDVIAQDYAVTQEALEPTMHWLALHEPEAHSRLLDTPAWALEARAETMRRFLEGVTVVHGSVTNLLRSLGVRNSSIARLRADLIGPPGASPS